MAKKDGVKALRQSREFIAYAERRGCEVVRGKGSHVKVRNPKGFAIIPDHTGDLAIGTCRAVVKAFISMGIAVLAALAILTTFF